MKKFKNFSIKKNQFKKSNSKFKKNQIKKKELKGEIDNSA